MAPAGCGGAAAGPAVADAEAEAAVAVGQCDFVVVEILAGQAAMDDAEAEVGQADEAAPVRIAAGPVGPGEGGRGVLHVSEHGRVYVALGSAAKTSGRGLQELAAGGVRGKGLAGGRNRRCQRQQRERDEDSQGSSVCDVGDHSAHSAADR